MDPTLLEQEDIPVEVAIIPRERVQPRERTAIHQATDDLSKQLEKFEVPDDKKREYAYEMQGLDTLTVMNMGVLAAALDFLDKYKDVNHETFTDANLMYYIRILMQKYMAPAKGGKSPSAADQRIVEHKFKQTILRYLIKVVTYRTQPEEEEEEELLPEEEEEETYS